MNKKTLKVLSLVGVVVTLSVFSFSKTYASSSRCANDKAYWEGEVGSKYVYSNIVDDQDDNYRIHGKVTVENDFGKTSYTEGWTKGTGKGGNHIHADIEKGINVPGLKCKATYCDDYPEYGPY